MTAERNEHYFPRLRPFAITGAGMLVLVFLAFGANRAIFAADPPQPDFFWPYGRVSIDGEPAQPTEQTVIGLVHGIACGSAATKVVAAGPGVPPEDVGATVYVVDVLAAGDQPGQRPGCGVPGDTVTLYFVGSRRIAVQQPTFAVGSQRVDVDLGPELSFQLVGAMVAGDGAN
ncbi:MAG: hypothetical protein AB7N24_16875 [Dehalococcoidia bacterium]